MSRDSDQKRKDSLFMETSRDDGQKTAYISNELQL